MIFPTVNSSRLGSLSHLSHILISLIISVLIAISVKPASAEDITMPNEYSASEKRALGFEIAQELRCPISDNRSLFDSQTQIANELKGHIFQKLDEGQSKQQIIDFMVARFGERIRYTPSFHSGTLALWVIPLGLILLAAFGGIAWIKKQQADSAPQSYENYYE
ncbi:MULTISPECIES: cytochrome c-type biogenesis protein CcmH [Shewanella]|uniref:Cytochrome c-type biogenesis protein n=1 Tax=Shewanella japonica TaxID=93973 RepID=A0ABM6JQW0_9GAMM|nr:MULTISPECIES: cytochrome c-type biogenesis protein CcmH [Shewanella]ARD23907.1 cytochrome c-type biogenesis protein CcmH [Shewanella japonica]KPZ72237.1 Cytochrome c-type biogenesis protein CcmH precursor [Shewanella sp. P1-14-1]